MKVGGLFCHIVITQALFPNLFTKVPHEVITLAMAEQTSLFLPLNTYNMPSFEVKYISDLRTEMTHLQSGTVVITDAPVDNQGKGEAFSPTDLVSSALCSCMLTIMGITAREHKFSIDGANARVTKMMASDPRRIAEVVIEIDFPDFPYSIKHKKIIEHISKTCPVAFSLHPELKQTIQLNFKNSIAE